MFFLIYCKIKIWQFYYFKQRIYCVTLFLLSFIFHVERSLLAFDPGRAGQDRQQAGSGMSTEKKSIRKQEEKAAQLAAPVVAEAPVAQVCTHHLPVVYLAICAR
jgi:hypothetical protein